MDIIDLKDIKADVSDDETLNDPRGEGKEGKVRWHVSI